MNGGEARPRAERKLRRRMVMKLGVIIRYRTLVVVATIASLLGASIGVGQMSDPDSATPAMPDISLSRGMRGSEPLDKLSPSLRILYNQFSTRRGGSGTEGGVGGFTSSQLWETFGIVAGDTNPVITLAVAVKPGSNANELAKSGMTTIARTGNTVYAMTRLEKVGGLANLVNVTSIGLLTTAHTPLLPEEEKPQMFSLDRGGSGPPAPTATTLGDQFNKQGLTGKGVIVGVIDTGIDWKHADFIKPDGTSRILAIWDLGDPAYQSSGGTIGSKPPVYLEDKKMWLGTVYSNAQINAAIKGTGTVKSVDRFGHGTAVAGTAASNGRATGAAIPAGTFSGVAPEADLLIVKASDCGSFMSLAELTSKWMIDTAQTMNRPIVVNMSFGGQYGDHSGGQEGERFIDSVVGPGLPGRIITISAGNDGQYSLHSSGRFGPFQKGQGDNFSGLVEVFVKEPSLLSAAFDAKDDWGLSFRSTNAIFQGADGKQAAIYLYKDAGAIAYKTDRVLKDPDGFNEFLDSVSQGFHPGPTTDLFDIQLPVGNYSVWAFGAGPMVKNGRFDLYSVSSSKASFGKGTDKTGMVGSPGNAKNGITVGSYDFRDRWDNAAGQTSLYNMLLGSASSYTNPGPRRDGVIKPDISSPARYTISPLSDFAKPVNGGCSNSMASAGDESITRDGFHIAWQGTSASAPFTAGVIALMLQKNPKLDAEQVRQILKKSARTNGHVGAVPNPAWGWGMLDPAAAIAATPLPTPGKRAIR